jgi:hypothetical protein
MTNGMQSEAAKLPTWFVTIKGRNAAGASIEISDRVEAATMDAAIAVLVALLPPEYRNAGSSSQRVEA